YGVLYFLLVFSLLLVPIAFYAIYTFGTNFDNNIILPIESLAPITIKDGQVEFDKPMPYLIKNKQGDVVGLIDTSGNTQGMPDKYPDMTFVLTQDKMYFRPPKLNLWRNTADPHDGQKVLEESISTQDLGLFVGKNWIKERGIKRIKWFGESLIYPMMLGSVFGAVSLLMMSMAFLVKLMSIIIFKFTIKLKEACRLTMVASTLAYLLFFVTYFFQIELYRQQYIYLIIVAIYSNFAVLSLRSESKKMVFG
ncbi:MAG: DUF1189 family protein, partial [Legionellales bacterium]|nr:DUF1189 family protein [Legionellales bacterium]